MNPRRNYSFLTPCPTLLSPKCLRQRLGSLRPSTRPWHQKETSLPRNRMKNFMSHRQRPPHQIGPHQVGPMKTFIVKIKGQRFLKIPSVGLNVKKNLLLPLSYEWVDLKVRGLKLRFITTQVNFLIHATTRMV